MDTVARYYLHLLIFLHIIFAIFVYGNSDIFEDDSIAAEETVKTT